MYDAGSAERSIWCRSNRQDGRLLHELQQNSNHFSWLSDHRFVLPAAIC
jgi:hypothetical protein